VNNAKIIGDAILHEDFHEYAIEWFTDHIDFYLDDYLYFTFENDGSGADSWPFDQPHYLILNIAVGGAWGGMHGVDDSIFPQQMQVDYARVFKARE
jgi:beta-glucanase (GH16 family)